MIAIVAWLIAAYKWPKLFKIPIRGSEAAPNRYFAKSGFLWAAIQPGFLLSVLKVSGRDSPGPIPPTPGGEFPRPDDIIHFITI